MHSTDELRVILRDDQISTKTTELEIASRDETHGLVPCMPEAVVWPRTTQEVSAVMKHCLKHRIPCTPRGAGTGKSGGCVPVHGGIVMCFDRMNQIIDINVDNLVAHVQPGVILGDFQKQVEAKNLFYPPDPASAAWCTIGGNIAENAGGPCALKYGVTRDYVLGLEVVLPNGDVVRTGKNTTKGVTGYDLTALMCGSEGTLGIVTEATLKLIPKPPAIQTALFQFHSDLDAVSSVSLILRNGILPRAIEYMDSSFGQATLIVELDGNTDDELLQVLTRISDLLRDTCTDIQIARNDKQRQQIWRVRKGLSESLRHLKPHRISEDIVIPRTQIPYFVETLRNLGQKYGITTCAFGHAGDGNLHAQMMFDHKNEPVELLLRELFHTTIHLGGTLTGEHGIGIAKQRFLTYEQSDIVIELQSRVKKAFDPEGILNPGKFLP